MAERNRAAALESLARVEAAVRMLGEFPDMGAPLSPEEYELLQPGIRFVVVEPYAVFYRASAGAVTVLSVNVNKVALVRNTRHLGVPSVTRAALLCLQYEDLVWPVTVFPSEGVYHSPRDVALAAPAALATLRVLSCDAAGLRPPGHWMHERVGRLEHYRALQSLLWIVALQGPRSELLAEIAGTAAYRATLSRDALPFASGALGPAAERLRRESVSLRDIAAWPGMSTERASRLLNALYLNQGLMVMRSHPAAREEHSLLSRLLRRDKPRR